MTLQLPVPEELRVIEQFVFAPVIFTMLPAGTKEVPVTLTLTETYAFDSDGSGVCAVIVMVVGMRAT